MSEKKHNYLLRLMANSRRRFTRGRPVNKQWKFNSWYAIASIWAFLLLFQLIASFKRAETIPYSDFKKYLAQDQIEEVEVIGNRIQGKLKAEAGAKVLYFNTLQVEPELADQLSSHKIKFWGRASETFFQDLLSWTLPTLFFLGAWFYISTRFSEREGGILSIGKSKAKIYVQRETKVSFADVAGVDEAKEELSEIVRFLKAPKEYGRLGGRLPKGILLVGPPGTGKTLLARAVAGEAGVTFLSISGSEFVEMFVGVGAARVRDLFSQAQKSAPCIIFIDELDALGRARGLYGMGGSHDEKEQTLNQLLAELDGFDPMQGVVLLAATNRPEILDSALLRAGRFDRQILVDRPDKKGRIAILQVHLKKIKVKTNLDIEKLASLTPGFTGADLANLINEAALLATRAKAEEVTMDHFTSAVERIVAGLEKKNRLLNPMERKIVAYHEMGHALAALALPGAEPLVKVSIIPRGIAALGYTIRRPLEDRYLMSRQELLDKMTVLLAGRAAESLAFPDVSTGAVDDLVKATEIARSMVTRFGMQENVGQVAYESENATFVSLPPGYNYNGKNYSEETAREIDCAVRELIENAFQCARKLIERKRLELDGLAEALLEKETLTQEELQALLKKMSVKNFPQRETQFKSPLLTDCTI